MTNDPLEMVLRQIRQVVSAEDSPACTDVQLLARFIAERDEEAFAAIVRRHAGMVMGVCRRVARDPHDAEDAFQATFLVLIRKAAAIAAPELLANWLYGVAYHTALKARALTMRRRTREKQLAAAPEPAARETRDGALQEWLDRELNHLPARYRAPIILCDLEGKSRKEAALLLGCPDGSLSSRLARGRTMLARRLGRRGLVVSAEALAVLAGQQATAAECAPALLLATISSAFSTPLGQASGSAVPPRVLALTEGMLKAMYMKKLRIAALLLAFGLAALAAIGWTYQALAGQGAALQQQPPLAVGKKGEKDAPKTDHKALQGKWHVVAAERYGMTWKNVDGAFVNQSKAPLAFPISLEVPGTVVFTGEECSLEFNQRPGRTLLVRDSFALDSARKPKWITLTADDGAMTYGIYELDGDTVRLAWQYGRRRNQRPTGFTTKKEIDGDDDVEVWVLNRQAEGAGGKAKPKAKVKGVPIQRSWDGILRDRTLIVQSPPEGIVVEAVAWEKMWKAWRPNEKVPTIDFAKELVLFQTVPGPNKIDPPILALDAGGNLKVPLPISTLIADDSSIGYTILVIDRADIVSVNGRALDKKNSKDV